MARTKQVEEGTAGHLIRRLRVELGVSQGAFAEMCAAHATGMSQSSISRWEHGEKPHPTWAQLQVIIRVAGGTDADFAEGLSLLTGVPLTVREVA